MIAMSSEHYQFKRPIKRVAIIGAGPGGVPAARQLRDHGIEVTIYERQDRVGGVWNWREETPRLASVPTPPPSRGAFEPVTEGDGEYVDERGDRRREFSPPGACYWNLSNNIPTKTMKFKDFPYPPGTPDNVPHYEFAKYVQDYWLHFGLDKFTSLRTRVEKVDKLQDGKWELQLRKQDVLEGSDRVVETTWTDHFDGVLVATGHYTAPLIPDIPGGSTWYDRFPDSIIHSQGYRRPETYTGKTVLIIGAGTSGMDIARDLSEHASRVLIASRVSHSAPESYRKIRALQVARIPPGSERIAQIACFRPVGQNDSIDRGEIELSDGSVVTGVDKIIWCTGYQYSYPFLPRHHYDPTPGTSTVPPADALVTNGENVLNLYRDIFYIPDPTLSFVGVSVNTSAFSFFEYQSILVSRVWSGQAYLPSQAAQRQELTETVAKKGDGKHRHVIGLENERVYVRDVVDWINRDAKRNGSSLVEGHSEEWLREADQIMVKIAAKYGLDEQALQGVSTGAEDDIVTDSVPVEDDLPAVPVKPSGFDLSSLGRAVAVV